MKKFVIATSVLTLIVVVALLVKRNSVEELEPMSQAQTLEPEAREAIEAAQTALGKPSATTTSNDSENGEELSVPPEEEGMLLTEEQMLKLEAHFEKVEKDWSDRMNQLFNKDLGLDPKMLQEYYKMREGYEQDKLDAFEDFHEEMIEKYGENYSYKPSEEEKMFTAKVRERYEQALIKLIGEQAYIRYTETRDQYNRELAEVEDKDLGFIKIDF